MNRPDRKPDVKEMMTQDQLNEAAVEWLVARGRIPGGTYSYAFVTLEVKSSTDAVQTIELWK